MTSYRYLRPQKALALKKWYDYGFYRKESLSCNLYIDAVILPLKKTANDGLLFGKGGVVYKEEFIEESGIEGRVGGYYDYTVNQYRDEKVVYCGALIHQWGHFLVESVARLWYFLENDETIDRYVFISNASNFHSKGQITGNYREFFELLGIWEKVELITEPIAFQEVMVPELGYSRKYYFSNQNIFSIIRENALKYCKDLRPNKKVYLSRSLLPQISKAEIGLDMLDNYFLQNGFSVLFPEKLSLHELIYYLHNADICAAESGTLPHNYLFCEDNKTVFIVERQTTVNEIQANIDIIKDLDVTYIDAHLTIYPTLAGYGPYFFWYNKQFKAFSEDMNFQPPDNRFVSEKKLQKNLIRFLKSYRASYGYCWGFEKWQLMYMDAYYEAYEESLEFLKPYLSIDKFLFWTDAFDIQMWKATVKKIIKR